jgi:hypothetical protein
MVLFLPETRHPNTRGVEMQSSSSIEGRIRRAVGFTWINPFASLKLLRSPNLTAVVRGFAVYAVTPSFLGSDMSLSKQTLAGTAMLLTNYGELRGV